ncbi:hypothetical protein ACIQPQ_31400 [Streptomyces sp. NPDC091281]|uniref:hypothetical protein n=1 Tax=Streptomyces sp. NPDC091281 TaxID=3365985 RepID=UPI00382F109F
MRPEAFRDHLVALLKDSPDVQRVAVVEGGPLPYALSAMVAGREQVWQVIGQLADGAKHDTPTAPVHGEPAVYTAASVSGAPDAWLGGVIGAAEASVVARVEVWSVRGRRSAGVTVFFHNGERVFVRLV